MKKYILIVWICVAILACRPAKELSPAQAINKLGKNPYIVIDGVPADNALVNSTNEENVASLSTYYGKEAIDKYGKQARDGAVIVQTKPFAKIKYQQVFSQKNPTYKTRLETEGNDDTNFLYVLNEQVLTSDFEGSLADITPETLLDLQVIEKAEVVRKFNINDKSVGILIKANFPAKVNNKKGK